MSKQKVGVKERMWMWVMFLIAAFSTVGMATGWLGGSGNTETTNPRQESIHHAGWIRRVAIHALGRTR